MRRALGCGFVAIGLAGLANAQHLEVVDNAGLVSVEWDSVPGVIYKLQANPDLQSGWTDLDGGDWLYGLGQRVSYAVYSYERGGAGAPGVPDPPSSAHTFAVAEFATQGKYLVSWQGDDAAQVLLDSSQLPSGLPPALCLDVPHGTGEHYSLTIVRAPLTWQAAYLSDPSLLEANLSGDQLLELAKLTAAYSEIQAAIPTGGEPQASSAEQGGDHHFFRLAIFRPDTDGDGIADADEFAGGIDAFHPDSDRDGYLDSDELAMGSDPNDGGSVPVISAALGTRFQKATIKLHEHVSELTIKASKGGKTWSLPPVINGPTTLPHATRFFTRGVEYRFHLKVTNGTKARVELIPEGLSGSSLWDWWAEFGDGRVDTINGTNLTGTGDGSSAQKILLPIDIAADADGDRQIDFVKDATTETEPFRFWTNSDTDRAEFSEGAPTIRDSGDSTIITNRDLEDFARLWVKVGSRLRQYKDGEIEIGLKWTNEISGAPEIKIYGTLGKSLHYLSHDGTALLQRTGPWKNPLATIHDGVTQYLSDSVFATTDGKFQHETPFLFEGYEIGQGELTLMLRWGGQEAVGPRYWMKLMDIRKMYERVKTDPDDPDEIPDPYDTLPPATYTPPVLSYEIDDAAGAYDPASGASDEYLIFVHGWRADYDDFIVRSETMFKRCWQQGYRGHFSSLFWPTYEGFNTFNASDYRGRLSGAPLKAYVESLPAGAEKHLASHSLGAVVVATALEQGLVVDKYFAIQAAIPAMTFDGTFVDWPEYETPDTSTNPASRALGHKDRIPTGTGVKIFNYLLTTDSATGGLWNTNNLLYKPEGRMHWSYRYSGGASDVTFLTESDSRVLTDPAEALSYAVRSRSRALGRAVALGAVLSNRVMDSMGDISTSPDGHNAPHKDPIQSTWEFYGQLVKDIKF